LQFVIIVHSRSYDSSTIVSLEVVSLLSALRALSKSFVFPFPSKLTCRDTNTNIGTLN
jgi:hypothetical protein